MSRNRIKNIGHSEFHIRESKKILVVNSWYGFIAEEKRAIPAQVAKERTLRKSVQEIRKNSRPNSSCSLTEFRERWRSKTNAGKN
jgi:hypothetical protein